MLGRGLESLIPNSNPEKKETGVFEAPPVETPAVRPAAVRKSVPPEEEAIFQIEVGKINPNPHQPRRVFDEEALKELAASIREFGIIQPIVVVKREAETETGTSVQYEIVAGERRWRAAKLAGLERIPAVIRKIDLGQNQLEVAVIENLQRADLNPLEAARAFAKLQDEFKITQREIAARIGKSRETVANTLRLLSLPAEIQEALSSNRINESQARFLLSVENIEEQKSLFRDILTKNLSVRALKEKSRPEEKDRGEGSPQNRLIIDRLEETLNAPVKIRTLKSGRGKVLIDFFSREELNQIVEKIAPEDV